MVRSTSPGRYLENEAEGVWKKPGKLSEKGLIGFATGAGAGHTAAWRSFT